MVAVLAVLAIVVATLLTGPPDSGLALDPRSAGPDGLRGLVEVAEALGTQVDISSSTPSDEVTHLLVVHDLLSPQQREQIQAWTRAGGQLVVTDPDSPLHDLDVVGQPIADMVGPSGRVPDCPLDALAVVDQVRHAGWTGFEVPGDGVGCFAGGEAAWLVAQTTGEGGRVALGSPASLLNRSLDRDDNAVLAATLLFPAPEARLQVMPPDTGPAQEVGISDLLPPRIWTALAVGLLAVVVALLALGRRLGPTVEELLPPTVPSAELARSVGDLLQRARSRDGAAARLREQARTEAGRVLGGGLEPEQLARQAHQRLEVDLDTARRALADAPVEHDDDLVAVAAAVAEVRRHLVTAS